MEGMSAGSFVEGLFLGGGTNMIGDDGHTNDFDHNHTEEDPAPGCPGCKGAWDKKAGTWG